MSVNVHIHREGRESEMWTLTGSNGANAYWLPLIRDHELPLLAVIFTAGLQVTEEYYAPLLEEITLVMSRLAELARTVPDAESANQRSRELHELLRQHPPYGESSVYIG